MPENETLPKGNTSKEWLNYADKKLQQFRDYHSDTNILGQLKHPQPLGDLHSRLLSQHELEARSKGMALKRQEETAPSYKKGGVVRKTGLTLMHAGERVIPTGKAAVRKTLRKSGRR